jgi:D-alanine-D-alanine ligase
MSGRLRRSHVAVLMGGWSAEREVSLVSGEACARALEEKDYRVTRVDVGPDLPDVLRAVGPDCCFNALHGRIGEDGRVQGLLDLMRLPYTHSGVLASAVAMDKPMAVRLFGAAGLACPDGYETTLGVLEVEGSRLEPPIVVKPAAEGSSVGVYILPDGELDPIFTRNDLDRSQRILVERYIKGRELTCAILEDRPLAVTEIVPRDGFYDYRAKYTDGYADHVVPAAIPPPIYEQVMGWALLAHRTLGCRGVSRADFRWDPEEAEGGLFILELNTQPGMTPLSLVPEQAAFCGIPFADLVQRLVEQARCDA